EWELADEVADWIQSCDTAVATVSPPEPVSAALGLGGSAATIVARLSVPSGDQGALVIHTPVIEPDMVASPRSLGSQVSLALEASTAAETALRTKSEARFRSLVAHSSDLITVLDRNGIVTYQSPSVEKLLGYKVEELEGTSFGDLLADTDRSRLER